MWDEVKTETGTAREKWLATNSKFFASAITAGAKMLRHLNTKESAEGILRQIINNVPLPLRFQQEIVDEKRNLDQTAVGDLLLRDLRALEEMRQKEQEEIRHEMEMEEVSNNQELQEEFRQELERREEDIPEPPSWSR